MVSLISSLKANDSSPELITEACFGQGAEDLLLFVGKELLLSRVAATPMGQCVTGGFVFQAQCGDVVGEVRDSIIHGTQSFPYVTDRVNDLTYQRLL